MGAVAIVHFISLYSGNKFRKNSAGGLDCLPDLIINEIVKDKLKAVVLDSPFTDTH